MIFFICLALLSISFSASAQSAAELSQIENYLNNMHSLKANFVQMASNGTTSEGSILIEKPNKIRLEYAPPTSVIIVGNGDYIVFNDQELDQVTNIDYDDIPATMILADKIKFDDNLLKITDFYKDSGTTSVTLEHSKSNDIGPITLVFSNSPFELKQWKIVDPQSVEVTLSLYDVTKNIDLDDNLFVFKKKPANKRKRR